MKDKKRPIKHEPTAKDMEHLGKEVRENIQGHVLEPADKKDKKKHERFSREDALKEMQQKAREIREYIKHHNVKPSEKDLEIKDDE